MLICVFPKTSGDFLLVSVKNREPAVKNIANRFAVWEFSNIPLEHTPDPQPTVYEGIPFIWGVYRFLGVCSICWGFLRSTPRSCFFWTAGGGSVGTRPQRMTLGWASVIDGYGIRVRKGWARNGPVEFSKSIICKGERRGWSQQSLLWRCPFWGGTCYFFILFRLKKAIVQWIWFHPPAFSLDVSVGHSSQSL